MKFIKESKIGNPLFPVMRTLSAFRLSLQNIARFFNGALTSRETSTHTYPLTTGNEYYLILLVAVVTGLDRTSIAGYFDEIKKNTELHEFVINKIAESPFQYKKELRCDFGNRVAWYGQDSGIKRRRNRTYCYGFMQRYC
jgi:hypothetical protein